MGSVDVASIANSMFDLGAPWQEKIYRTILIYLLLLVALRLAGKRQLMQLTTFDFVVILLLSNTIQNGIIGSDNSVTGAAIGAVVLLFVNNGIAWLLFRSTWLNNTVQGNATTIIEDGTFDKRALRSLRLRDNEVVTLIRHQNLHGVRDVKHGVVEATGSVTIDPFDAHGELHALGQILHRMERIERALNIEHEDHAGPVPSAPEVQTSGNAAGPQTTG